MTIYFPDCSQFQSGMSLEGALAVCCRATEGNWLADSAYTSFKNQAQRLGIFQYAYHFLESGSTVQSQAAFCHSVVGSTPLMLDFEPITGKPLGGHTLGASRKISRAWPIRRLVTRVLGGYISEPSVSQALGFIDAFRALGGRIHLVYLPKWYWQALGSPALKPFTDRDVHLVSSDFTTYSDSGIGWQSYGGMSPLVWQYSMTIPFNGLDIDFNAFKGTLPELKSYVTNGQLPVTPPFPRPAYTEDSMIVLDLIPSIAVSLPVPAGKSKLLLYADALGNAAPKIRVGWSPAWNGAHTLEPSWEKPAEIVVSSGASHVTLSRMDKSSVPVTVDWA